MAKAGYTGAQPSRTAREQSYPGAWTGQEQYVERKANTWSLSPVYDIERSLRFNSSDSAFLSRNVSSETNRKTFTFAAWVKRNKLGSGDYFLFHGVGGSGGLAGYTLLGFSADQLWFNDGFSGAITSTAKYRDPSAWYHVVFAVDSTQATDSNRVKMYVNGVQLTSFSSAAWPSLNRDFTINAAVQHTIGWYFSASNDFLLADIHFIDGQALDPSSFTEVSATTGQLIPKAYTGTYGTNGFHLPFSDNSTAAALGTDTSGNGNTWTVNNISVGVTSVTNPAWYASSTYYSNVADVLANATNKGSGSWTASNEFVYLVVNSGGKPGSDNVSTGNFPILWVMYRNTGGTLTRQGSFGGSELPSFDWSDSVGTYTISNFADFYIFSGQDANPPTGGQLSGTIPALTTASFRTVSDFNAANDSLVDTPTSYGTDTGAGGEVRGNYCTWNPLTGAVTLTNGNLDGNSTGGAWRGATGTAGVLSGKWYWESTIQSTDSGNYYGEFGFIKTTDITGAITFPSGMNGIVYYARNGRKISGGTSVVTSSSGATTGDVVQVAVDLDAGKIWFGVNNTWIDSGNPASGTNAAYTGLSGTYLPVIGVLDGGKCNTNWGARPFAYTAPSGFKALCDTNLPAPVVAKPSTVMDVKLYTGNGGTQTISGLGFSPDLVWLKSRSGAYNHRLVDRVQGNTSTLASNLTAAAVDCSNDFTGFTNDGFSLNQTVDFELNRSSTTYVAWAWDAGSTTVTNTQGSITSQVRANASAGFSVVTYTGTGGTGTVGHGLGVAPSMIIVKNRSNAVNWAVAHAGIDSNRCLNLNRDVDASTVGFLGLDKSSFASTTFTVNYSDTSTTVVNGSSNNYVAYCFAPVAGYSAFGSYTGNGSSDGPFVYTGFRPKWVMIKGISGGDHWYLYDSVRLGYNPRNEQLTPNLSDAEYDALSYPNIDICANGFKLRTTIGGRNSSGVLYAYAAFAESPFAYARAR